MIKLSHLCCLLLLLTFAQSKPQLLSADTFHTMTKHLESYPPAVGNVGSDIFSQLFNDLYNWIKEPSMGRFLTLVGDFSMFYLIPFVSGFLRAEARR